MEQGGYDLPILLDAPGSIANSYRVAYVPTAVIIDAQGQIVQSKVGETTADELESMVAPLR
jgi:hypothetical protein